MQTKAVRLQEMDQYLAKRFQEIFYERTQETMSYLQTHKNEVLQSLLAEITSSSDSVKPLIDNGKKGQIKYLQLSYLLSGVLNKKLKLKIDFYDAMHYGDYDAMHYGVIDAMHYSDIKIINNYYWDYAKLFPYIDEDMEILRIELWQQFRRFKNYELLDIGLYYHIGIFSIVLTVLKTLVADKAFAEALSRDVFASEVALLYGAYLGQSEVIAVIKRK